MARTVSDSLLAVLVDAGVRRIFGVPGDAVNAVIDGIRRHPDLEFVGVRHEEAGAFAASAQAKLTGELAAVVGTAGPGAIHLLNGLYDAKLDHAPVLAITGQTATGRLALHSHQEIDQHLLFAGVAVFSATVVDPAQLPAIAVAACQAALAAPGVAHLALPANVASADAPGGDAAVVVRRPSNTSPASEDVQAALEVLRASERPLILAGIGARGAVPELLELAARLGAPIIKTLRGKDLIPDDHPDTLGGLGLLGTRPAVGAVTDCDALVMVGTDFPYVDFYPEGVPVIQIDVDRARIGLRTAVTVPLVGHAHLALRALNGGLEHRADRSWSQRTRGEMAHWRERMQSQENDDAMPIKPQRLAAAVGRLLDPDAIVIADTGTVTAWTARHLSIRGEQRFTLSGNLASMGYGIPAAIGAQLAFPGRQVVALVGDGSFTMLPTDLLTAVDRQLPITIVVFNNGKLGLITLEQEVEGLPDQSTEIPAHDLFRIAEALGAQGFQVSDPAELDGVLAAALASPRPSVVEVLVDPDELIIPPRIELAQALGFAEAKVKEFFGRVR